MTSSQSGTLRTFPRFLATQSALDSVSSLSPTHSPLYLLSISAAISKPSTFQFYDISWIFTLSDLLFSAISSSLTPGFCLTLALQRSFSPFAQTQEHFPFPSSNPCCFLSNSPLLLLCVLQGTFLSYFKSCDQSVRIFAVVEAAFPSF